MRPNLPLRIGILGAAGIARQFVAGVAPSALVTVAAVASRDAAKAQAFVSATGIVARTHASYAALLADPGIDAVYNPLPNGLHAAWSIRAAEAGKHVLCEKPLAATEAEARAMFAAAKRHQVHIVEAYPYLAQEQTQKVLALVRSGAIGRLRLMRASFGFSLPMGPNIRFDAGLAGGAVMDAGSYPVSLVRVVMGVRPTRVHALADWYPGGVDRTLTGTLEFPDGAVAQVSASFATGYHRSAEIVGEAGAIETAYLNHPPIGGTSDFRLRRGTGGATATLETITVTGGNGFRAEAESFARLVHDGPAHWTGATPQESIDVAATLEALLASARSGNPVTLKPA